MNRRNRRRRKGKSNKIKWAVGVFLTMLLLCAILYMTAHFLLWNQGNSPEEVLISYMNCISEYASIAGIMFRGWYGMI